MKHNAGYRDALAIPFSSTSCSSSSLLFNAFVNYQFQAFKSLGFCPLTGWSVTACFYYFSNNLACSIYQLKQLIMSTYPNLAPEFPHPFMYKLISNINICAFMHISSLAPSYEIIHDHDNWFDKLNHGST